jgi:hypothetical protein
MIKKLLWLLTGRLSISNEASMITVRTLEIDGDRCI